MKKCLVILLILIGVLVAGAGLVYILVPKETLLAKIRPEIGNFRVEGTSIGLQYSTVNVIADVTSKAIPVFIDSLAYQITIADEQITQGRQTFAAESQQGNVQTLSIPVKLTHEEARKLVQLKARTGAPLVARIQAYCDLPLVGQKRFDFYKDVDVPLPTIPGLEVF